MEEILLEEEVRSYHYENDEQCAFGSEGADQNCLSQNYKGIEPDV